MLCAAGTVPSTINCATHSIMKGLLTLVVVLTDNGIVGLCNNVFPIIFSMLGLSCDALTVRVSTSTPTLIILKHLCVCRSESLAQRRRQVVTKCDALLLFCLLNLFLEPENVRNASFLRFLDIFFSLQRCLLGRIYALCFHFPLESLRET